MKSTVRSDACEGRLTELQLPPPFVETNSSFDPYAKAAPRATSARCSEARLIAPPTPANVLPPSVDRLTPRGPIRNTRFASSASTEAGWDCVPVLSSAQLAPSLVLFSSVPALSSAKPTLGLGKATSITSPVVGTPRSVHVSPPSVVVYSVPLSPTA